MARLCGRVPLVRGVERRCADLHLCDGSGDKGTLARRDRGAACRRWLTESPLSAGDVLDSRRDENRTAGSGSSSLPQALSPVIIETISFLSVFFASRRPI